MFDYGAAIIEAALKYGWSLPLVGGLLLAVYRQRPTKRWLRKHYPRLVLDESDVMNYEARQIRIENDVRAIKAHLGVTGCVERNDLSQNSGRPLLKFSIREKLFARIAAVFIQKELTIYSRRHKQMREYLKKLSKTKLQAYLLATIMNISLLVGYVMDVQDIQSKVESWMPMVNMTIQTVLTLIYVWVEGSIDKEQIKAQAPDVKIGDSGPAE